VSPVLAAAFGLIAGGVLGILTYGMARFGPVGDGWSFRGNGALVVPFGVGPAILAGGWVALVLRSRGAEHWRALGLAAACAGALPALASILVLVIAGGNAQPISDVLTLPALAWPVVAVLLAVGVPLRAGIRSAPLRHGIAAIGWTVGLIAGFLALGVVLPAG
jgi:hypothetical protein